LYHIRKKQQPQLDFPVTGGFWIFITPAAARIETGEAGSTKQNLTLRQG
jgi:hypothetical protein